MFKDTTKNTVTGLPSTQMDIFTTPEECSDGELGGCRTACRVELPPLSMFRWDSDSVRSDSPPSEVRYSLSPAPARCSRAPSGWYLPGGHTRVTKILFTRVFTLHKPSSMFSSWIVQQVKSNRLKLNCPLIYCIYIAESKKNYPKYQFSPLEVAQIFPVAAVVTQQA